MKPTLGSQNKPLWTLYFFSNVKKHQKCSFMVLHSTVFIQTLNKHLLCYITAIQGSDWVTESRFSFKVNTSCLCFPEVSIVHSKAHTLLYIFKKEVGSCISGTFQLLKPSKSYSHSFILPLSILPHLQRFFAWRLHTPYRWGRRSVEDVRPWLLLGALGLHNLLGPLFLFQDFTAHLV